MGLLPFLVFFPLYYSSKCHDWQEFIEAGPLGKWRDLNPAPSSLLSCPSVFLRSRRQDTYVKCIFLSGELHLNTTAKMNGFLALFDA